MNNKPKAKLIGANGNIFNLMGIAAKAIKTHYAKQGEAEKGIEVSQEMVSKITSSKSYNEALRILDEYVEIV